MKLQELQRDDKITRLVWTGGETYGIVGSTVLRVNRVTVTLESEHGGSRRWTEAELNRAAARKVSESEAWW